MNRRIRATSILAAGAAMALLGGQGVASGTIPLPIEPSMLPEDAAPAPPQATEQRTLCIPAAPGGEGPDIPLAQRDLAFDAVWPLTTGIGQRIAVIDTGVNPHPRLPNVEAGGDYVGPSDGTEDCDAHGTVVAGLIGAQPQNGSGFSGAAPGAVVISIRQSSSAYSVAGRQDDPTVAENSSGYGNVDTMAMAVRRAADLGATVINISEVACKSASDGINDQRLGAAIQYAAVDKDVVIVAAAGNVGSGGCKTQNPPPNPLKPDADPWNSISTIASPAWYDDYVLTVGSVDPNGAASPFSLGGPWVDVAAPGTGIVSLHPSESGLTNGTFGPDGAFQAINGTSFAAPYVAATVALVRSRYPALTATQVVHRIESTAHAPAEGWNPYVGHGVIDPLAAVTAIPTDSENYPLPAYSTAIAPLPILPPADNRARDAALLGVTCVGILGILALLASFPIRRKYSERTNS
ncbi:type VII secretion-associated serine protease mycosin [Rhodococcus sp. IEGM 1379]|uniref:type VII secretion-associated serine protease mycosin n=1 Tax=Rhodococcus sp. IEGM 1379 TaxID=3047086 RepID=UPI0024B6D034|nr:type VII secretion-associated serine protease mycosin [Rhodococcus sp. IEGM 1379]MDI9917915.1 type VII secretion-associated serine protease mycosin [Rhodococcus sp. IEGM 1379]